MLYRAAGDLVVLVHLAFVLFVAGGALLVLRWRWLAWAHLPAALWGGFILLSGRVCPLTPLENRLRLLAGRTVYEGGFIEHYVLPVLYPPGLTHQAQVLLGGLLLVGNAGVYLLAARRRRRAVV